MPQTAEFVTALVGCSIGTVTDLRWRRVPNWITLPLPVLAIAFTLPSGPWAVGREIVLIAALTLAGVALHAMGMLGGGDVKLIIGVGALLGYPACVSLLLYTAVAGGILALAAALVRRRASELVRNVGVLLSSQGRYAASGGQTIPYAVAIAAGLVATILSLTSVPALRIPL